MRHVWFLLLSLSVLITACGSSQPSSVVAMVHNHPITRQEVTAYLRYAVAFDALAYPGSAQAGCGRHPHQTACLQLADQALARLVQERVVLDYATHHHITLSAAEQRQVSRELTRLSAPGSPTRALFKSGKVGRRFMRSVLDRQVLIQKVEKLVAGRHAVQGPELHIRRYAIPIAGRAAAAYRATVGIAGGGVLPVGTQVRDEWIARFRLSSELRSALTSAKPGEYVGPFRNGRDYVLVQLLARQMHRYGAPAQAEVAARFFHTWLATALRDARPRCLDSHGHLAACPPQIMNAA